jgi:hypothetical protein
MQASPTAILLGGRGGRPHEGGRGLGASEPQSASNGRHAEVAPFSTDPPLRVRNEEGTDVAMLPLYMARLRDLRRGDLIKIDCAACDHVALLTPEALLLRLGGNRAAKVLDLKERLRCRGCGRRGRAVVSIKWRQRG